MGDWLGSLPREPTTKEIVAREVVKRLVDERIKLMVRIQEIDLQLEPLLVMLEAKC